MNGNYKVYYNVQQLEEKQYIKKVDQLDNTRETNNYIITELGNKEFEKLMCKYGSKTEYVNLSFYAARECKIVCVNFRR